MSDRKHILPIVARDDYGACASLLALLHEVSLLEALALVGGLQLLREFIVADTAGVYNRALRKNVLYARSDIVRASQ